MPLKAISGVNTHLNANVMENKSLTESKPHVVGNDVSGHSSLTDKQRQAVDQCEQLIKDFARRADRNKSSFKRLQFISVFLGICTTILSALSANKKLNQFEWIVPLASGMATLATTLLSQTNAQKLWVSSRGISQKFHVEKFLYRQESGDYKSVNEEDERLKLFSKKVMDIWSQAQESWAQNTSSTK
jgi:hypothetical protein